MATKAEMEDAFQQAATCAREPVKWLPVAAPLTPEQRYDLVCIAHETSDPTIRDFALRILAWEFTPQGTFRVPSDA